MTVVRNGVGTTTTSLQAGDAISTGSDGGTLINFGNVRVWLYLQSRFVIAKLTQAKLRLEEIWGKIKVLCTGDGGKWFEFLSDEAVAKAVGTEFILEVAQGGTTLTILEGAIEFSDLAKTEIVLVGENQSSVVTFGGTPSDPVSIDPAEIDRWWEWEEEAPAGVSLGTPLAVAVVVIVVLAMLYLRMRRRSKVQVETVG